MGQQADNEMCQFVQVEDQPYVAIDVCRTIVTSGTAEYRKYVCDGTEPKEEVYDDIDCTGDVIATYDVTSEANSCDSDYQGECYYVMTKYPCGESDTTYTIEPVLIDECAQLANYAYRWNDCSLELQVYFEFAACNDALDSKIVNATSGVCLGVENRLKVAAQSDQCQTKYYGPTEEPTLDPTIDPTSDPTLEPTYNPTGDPTVNPTTMAPAEDMTTTADIDEIIPDTSFTFNIITNCIFLSFTVLFLSFF